MRKKKPTLAGLKRQLAAAESDVCRWHDKFVDASFQFEGVQEKIRDLEGDVKALNKQVAWHEREREKTLEYFDEALKLFKPHLIPATHGGIENPENSLERFLLQVRERLSRYYDPMGRNLYRKL